MFQTRNEHLIDFLTKRGFAVAGYKDSFTYFLGSKQLYKEINMFYTLSSAFGRI